MVKKNMEVSIVKECKHLGRVGRVVKVFEEGKRFSVSFGGRGRPTFFTEADVIYDRLESVEKAE